MYAAGNPGDVSCQVLINGNDVTHLLRRLAVFEDIKKPYTVIQGLLFDYGNSLNGIPIQGNATLQATFFQPPDQTPQYTGTWILSTVKVHKASEGMKTVFWSFQGYSPQMFVLPRVQKSYQEVPMSSVVSDLVTNYLPGLIKPLIVRAPSMNMAGNVNMPYVVNNQQPFSAIRAAMQASASAVDPSSVYVLFENLTNMVLDTVQNLINNPISGGPTYWQRLNGQSFLNDPQAIQSSIISYHKDDMIDTTAMIQASSQDIATYDIFGQAFQAATSAIAGGVGSAFGGAASSVSSIMYNMFRPPTYAQQIAAPRRIMAAQADAQSVTAQVLLNPALTVGTQVTLNLLGSVGDVQSADFSPYPGLQDWQSGNFLIQETRHDVALNLGGRLQGTTTVRGIPPTVTQLQ